MLIVICNITFLFYLIQIQRNCSFILVFDSIVLNAILIDLLLYAIQTMMLELFA